jgi:hypothetical protein
MESSNKEMTKRLKYTKDFLNNMLKSSGMGGSGAQTTREGVTPLTERNR